MTKRVRINSTHFFSIQISNNLDLQQNLFHYSKDIYFQDFMNFYKKCTAKSYSLLAIDTFLASDNHFRFRKNLSRKTKKLIMTIDNKVRYEKLQYDLNRKAAKTYHYHQVKWINVNIFEVKNITI